MSRYVPLIEVVRGKVNESQHSGALVRLSANGDLAASLGDVEADMYPRSTVKLIQTAAMLENGLELEPRLLALVASSHSGGDEHARGVEVILNQYKLSTEALQCTPFLPLGTKEKSKYVASGGAPSHVRADCSGKHAGFLATCVINGWSTHDYLEVGHPLQLAIKSAIERATGDEAKNVTVDGCGAPLWTISLHGLARSYHRAVVESESALRTVADAMRDYPDMVGGSQREATVLMQKVAGVVAKDGADGVFVAARDSGESVAFKIGDGSRRGLTALVATLMNTWGSTDFSDLPLAPPMGAGRVVGQLVPTTELLSALG